MIKNAQKSPSTKPEKYDRTFAQKQFYLARFDDILSDWVFQ